MSTDSTVILCTNCGYLRELHSIEPPYDMNGPHGFYCDGFSYIPKTGGTDSAKHTPGEWYLLTLGGRLPAVKRHKMPHGEADTFSATITTSDKPPFKHICELDFGYGKPVDLGNAERIVRAANAHDSMLSALKADLDGLNRILYHYSTALPEKVAAALNEMRLKTGAAISKAEVKP